MKLDMRKWSQEFIEEQGTYTLTVIEVAQGITDQGRDYMYISFAGADGLYTQRYYLKNGSNSFFVKDCIKIMGSSDSVLSGDFDTDEMLDKTVIVTLEPWGDKGYLNIADIKQVQTNGDCPF